MNNYLDNSNDVIVKKRCRGRPKKSDKSIKSESSNLSESETKINNKESDSFDEIGHKDESEVKTGN